VEEGVTDNGEEFRLRTISRVDVPGLGVLGLGVDVSVGLGVEAGGDGDGDGVLDSGVLVGLGLLDGTSSDGVADADADGEGVVVVSSGTVVVGFGVEDTVTVEFVSRFASCKIEVAREGSSR